MVDERTDAVNELKEYFSWNTLLYFHFSNKVLIIFRIGHFI